MMHILISQYDYSALSYTHHHIYTLVCVELNQIQKQLLIFMREASWSGPSQNQSPMNLRLLEAADSLSTYPSASQQAAPLIATHSEVNKHHWGNVAISFHSHAAEIRTVKHIRKADKERAGRWDTGRETDTTKQIRRVTSEWRDSEEVEEGSRMVFFGQLREPALICWSAAPLALRDEGQHRWWQWRTSRCVSWRLVYKHTEQDRTTFSRTGAN